MSVRDTGAEQKIKDTAKRLYFTEGRINATILDIAEAAGVSRTLVNYYFRSADALIQQVFKEALIEHDERFDKVMAMNLPFKEKIENLIDVFLDVAIAFPYQETFLFQELNMHGDDTALPNYEKTRLFLSQIQEEMDKGSIKAMNPVHFIMNLFGLLAYPLIMKPMFGRILKVSDEEYSALIKERKEIIFNMIFQ